MADELSGPFDLLQSSVSPGSGFLESDPEWRDNVLHHLKINVSQCYCIRGYCS